MDRDTDLRCRRQVGDMTEQERSRNEQGTVVIAGGVSALVIAEGLFRSLD